MIEITDVIVDYDPASLQRRPVKKADALAKLQTAGASRFALSCVSELPEAGGTLDEAAVDGVIISAHAEMQRLWETFLHGERVSRTLAAIIRGARAAGITERLRVVDVGCGCGYVLRWLAAHRMHAEEITLLGVDYNRALIEMASALAAEEQLDVRFQVVNAFELEEPAHVFISTGVIHHFDAMELPSFFAQQADCDPLAFVHFDARRSWASPIGAWLFHKAKFRGRIGQHDGYWSAVRAHATSVLLSAAQEGAPSFRVRELNRGVAFLPFLRAMHAVAGVRPSLADEVYRGLP